MENVFLPALVGLTSAGGYVLATIGLGRSPQALREAVARMFEYVGVVIAFFGANLLVGVAGLLLLRFVTGRYVSPYLLADAVLLVLSAFQALVFQSWCETRALPSRRSD